MVIVSIWKMYFKNTCFKSDAFLFAYIVSLIIPKLLKKSILNGILQIIIYTGCFKYFNIKTVVFLCPIFNIIFTFSLYIDYCRQMNIFVALNFVAIRAVAKTGMSLKSNHQKQIWLYQIFEALCTKCWQFLFAPQ